MPNYHQQYNMNNNMTHTTNNNLAANGNSQAELTLLSNITPDIRMNQENDLTSLFSRIPSFADVDAIALDPLTSYIERQQSIKKDSADLKNIDLTEILLQEQNNHIDTQQLNHHHHHIINNLDSSNRRILRSFSKDKSSPSIQFTNANRFNLADNKLYNTRQQKILPSTTTMPTTSAMANSNVQMTNGGKQMNGFPNNFKSKRVEVKRLSSTSNSTASSATENKEKRGRKPTGAPANQKTQSKTEKLKLQAKMALQVEEDKLARFGNKYVVKNTMEYDDRRKKNNEAVQKCRQKNAEEQKLREETMKKLTDENNRLNNRVTELTKELSVLKSIVLKSTPINSLPESIQKLMLELESANQK